MRGKLRHALLDKVPNAALVMSSLDLNIPGMTDSGRPLTRLPQCEALDPGEIVTKWWKITESQLQFRFELIAAMLCDLPRALEIANTYIQDNLAEVAHSTFAASLVKNVKQLIEERYAVSKDSMLFPSPPLLKAMVFKSKYVLDSEVSAAIRDSLLTNVLDGAMIKRVSMQRNEPVMFTPRVNLYMLAIQTDDPESFSGRFLELMRTVLTTTVESTDDEGDCWRSTPR